MRGADPVVAASTVRHAWVINAPVLDTRLRGTIKAVPGC